MGMLAGMWGLKSGVIDITNRLEKFVSTNNLIWGSDQTFIYPIYEMFNQDMVVHDPFHSNKPFPSERKNFHFIGERFDGDNNRFDDYLILKQWK
jgi:hypothetical protein